MIDFMSRLSRKIYLVAVNAVRRIKILGERRVEFDAAIGQR